MVECSLCSVLSFFGTCIYKVVATTLEHPVAIFLLSLLITIILISNVTTARLICDIGNAGARGCAIGIPCSTNASCSTTASTSISDSFDYGPERGPHTWNCPDINQSPINIINECVEKLPVRELLTWNHYDDLPNAIMLENNGHTVIVRAVYPGNVPTLSGADLIASYTFVEMCFRWSLLDNEGSEHMLNYRKYPLELQAMHRTGPSGDCTSSYDILMVSYFYDISSNNPYLDPLIQNLHRIQRPNTKIEIAPFPISYLCHPFRTNFYSYGGSLTEPPCYEGAEWFIFPEPLAISQRQLNEFRQILSADGKTRIIRNSRPVQNLNDSRVINLNQYRPLQTIDVEETTDNNNCNEEDD